MNDTLPLRYCAAGFASKIPTWRLLAGGNVVDLVTGGGEEVGMVQVEPGRSGVDWVSGPGERWKKRARLNRRTPAHLVERGFWGSQSPPRVWKRSGILDGARADAKRRCLYQQDEACVHVQDRTGVG